MTIRIFFTSILISVFFQPSMFAQDKADDTFNSFTTVQLGFFTEINQYISPVHFVLGRGKMNEAKYKTWNLDFKYLGLSYEGFSDSKTISIELERYLANVEDDWTYGMFFSGFLSSQDVTPEHPYAFGSIIREGSIRMGPKFIYLWDRQDKNLISFSAKLYLLTVGIDNAESKNPNHSGPRYRNYGFNFEPSFTLFQFNVGWQF